MSTSERKYNLKDLYKDGSLSIELLDIYPEERDFVTYIQADIDSTQRLYETLHEKGLFYEQYRQDDGQEA